VHELIELETLVDTARLATWMDGHGLGSGPIRDPALLTGGTQNILLRFRRADREYVLRRPSKHKRANSDETMRREAAVLAALAGTDVPHPRLIAVCPDPDVIGASFYLMSPVRGFNPATDLPEPHASDQGVQREMGLRLVDALAAIGRVAPGASGLARSGRDRWLERQVARWRAQLESYAELGEWSSAALPPVADLEGWLDAHRPSRWRPGLIHGDYHPANVMISPDGPEVAAVVDWELAAIGDPLLDLGHLLATWPDPAAGATAATVLSLPGFPSRAELVERYAAGTDRDLDAVDWYRALACYRLGVLLEGAHARSLAGRAPVEVGARLHEKAVALFEQGLELAGGFP
jgi:aminoglycoside phosphotransferase (APT) family kinase protein